MHTFCALTNFIFIGFATVEPQYNNHYACFTMPTSKLLQRTKLDMKGPTSPHHQPGMHSLATSGWLANKLHNIEIC
jgi:hypothetical protein